MLEALELQHKRAEDTIQREDDARRRAEEAITRLETLESKLRTLIEAAHDEPDEPTVPKPPAGIAPSSGSLQASPRIDAQKNQSEPAPQGAGNEQLARMLRRIAEQLITASDEKSDSPAKTRETTTGITVKRPVELDLGISESTPATRD
jgi:hypothetical protein